MAVKIFIISVVVSCEWWFGILAMSISLFQFQNKAVNTLLQHSIIHFPTDMVYHEHPYPFAIERNFLEQNLFSELARDFPAVPESVVKKNNSRGNKSIFFNTTEYDLILRTSEAWRRLHYFVHSQAMIDYGMKFYGRPLQDHPECMLHVDKATYKEFIENHFMVKESVLFDRRHQVQLGRSIEIDGKHYDRNTLFSRMDFFHGPSERYHLGPHLDWPHRVFTVLIYFTDTNSTTGGALRILERNGDGNFRVIETVYPKVNTAVSFLSALPSAWHEAEIFRGPGFRKLIQIQVSAHYSVCRSASSSIRHPKP
ncbi:unnamed protein product [Adineta steineri]|uniref:Prolyl 4-hydroxylase alpha subunit Fe(2+) 2OG dioxygenase domain-containing protein n=2 Tax=Adineta steineri TaxID=433720 RepID=A0A814H7P7_9BILA|nr:unnamed protein product [Adineta steineri]CAF1041163.1 unnamed protein product [Adineta steineri]CAF1166715.1 unnamed protein product [Adineta steineri]CAF4037829.1 unnamed protein product [Adineta steineri]